MLYQDALTGALHEAPDGQLYESDFAEYPYQMGEPVYDGLGNPVGFLPFIPKIASLASSLLPKVGGLVGNLFRPRSPVAALQQAAAALPAAAAALPPGMNPMASGMPGMPFRRPWPAGWIRPPLPYTGLGPRRLYMRCAVWPGPKGLVPAMAAQAPIVPAQAAAAAAAQTAAAMGRRFGRRRGRRR